MSEAWDLHVLMRPGNREKCKCYVSQYVFPGVVHLLGKVTWVALVADWGGQVRGWQIWGILHVAPFPQAWKYSASGLMYRDPVK